MNIWREQMTLRFGSVDKSDRMTLGAAVGFFQEAAISHADVLGVGRDAMTTTGQAWVLSRLSVFIEERPRYGETLTVRSWPRGPEKLFCLRDYDIINAKGKTVARGRSGWIVLDSEKRRPVRVEAVVEKLPLNEGENALLSGPRGLTGRDDAALLGERKASYSDIDYYGHVNNVSYVSWIEDATPHELLEKAGQARFDINYLREILPGENVEIWAAPLPSLAGPEFQGDCPASPTASFAYEGRRHNAGNNVSNAGGIALFRAELRLGA